MVKRKSSRNIEELLDAKGKYQFLVDCTQELIFILDKMGKIRFANKAAIAAGGYTEKELIGKRITAFLTKDSIKKSLSALALEFLGRPQPLMEVKFKTKSGEIRFLEVTAGSTSVADQCGKMVGLLVNAHDITEKKKAEGAIRKSEVFLNEVCNIAKIGGWEMDLITRKAVWTKGLYDIMEMDYKNPVPGPDEHIKYYRPEYRQLVEDAINNLIERDISLDYESEYLTAKGNIRWCRILGKAIKKNGKCVKIFGTAQDITERKNAEEKLKASQVQLTNAMYIAHLGPWEYDVEKDLFTFTDEFYGMFRTSAKKVGGYTMSSAEYARQFVHPEDAPIVGKEVCKAIETDDPMYSRQLEHRVIFADGEIGHISVCFFIVKNAKGKTVRTFGVNQDITAQKKIEKEIREQEEHLRLALKGGDLGTWDWNLKTNEIQFNERWAEMKGYNHDEIKPHLSTWEPLVHPEDLPDTYKKLNAHLEGKTESYEAEFRMKHKSGKWVWILDRGKVIEWDEQGKPQRASGTHLDITVRKNAEEELKKTNQQLQDIIDFSPSGIMTIDTKGLVTTWSPACEEIFGWKCEEVIGKFNPTVPAEAKDFYFKTIGEKLKSLEIKVKTKKGSMIDISISTTPLFQDDKLIGSLGVMTDITEGKKARDALRQSEEKFRMIAERSKDIIFTTDEKGRLTYISPAVQEASGHTVEECEGKSFLRFLPKSEIPKAMKEYRTALKGQSGIENFSLKLKHKNKQAIYGEVSASPVVVDGKVRGTQGIIRDITERHLAKVKLEESELKYRGLVEDAGAGVATTDLKGRFTFVNHALCRMLGYSKDEMIGKPFAEFLHPQDKPAIMKIFLGAIVKPGRPVDLEFRVFHKDGHTLHFYSKPTVSKKGKQLIGFNAIIEDITARKQGELKEKQHVEALSFLSRTGTEFVQMLPEKDIYNVVGEHLRTLIDDAYICISSFDEREKTFTIRKLIGLEPHIATILKVLGQPLTGLTLRLDHKSWYAEMTAGKLMQTSLDEIINVTSSAVPRQLQRVVAKFSNPDQVFSVGIYYNNRLFGNVVVVMKKGCSLQNKSILENYINQASIAFQRKQIDDELREAHKTLNVINKELERKVADRTAEIERLLKQKDEFVNQLGHDLKNPLTPLVTLIPIIKKRQTDEKTQELLGVIEENVNFMRNLVAKTLELARLNAPSTMFDIKLVNLYDKISKLLTTQQLLFDKKSIAVENLVSKDLVVQADNLQLEELFNNLLNNAIKYTPERGTITIDAQERDDMVTISVTDTGIGMTEDQIRHVFDEFYKVDSSRHDFDSSGLGLAIAKRIAEKHGGKIWAESKGKDKGTAFYFTLKQGTESK